MSAHQRDPAAQLIALTTGREMRRLPIIKAAEHFLSDGTRREV